MALDVCVLDEHDRAGVLIAETQIKNPGPILAKVPGITSVQIQPSTDNDRPRHTSVMRLKPRGDVVPLKADVRKDVEDTRKGSRRRWAG